MANSGPTTYPDVLTILQYPAPVLRKLATPVTAFDERLRAFAERMFETMYAAKGVGLAAPQVGVSRRLFVTDHAQRDGNGHSDRRVFINPRIENASGEETYEEGCLSFPGVYAKVTRHNRFDFVYQDLLGFEQRLTLDVEAGDFLGVVVQHELDHLDGKVFVDHLTAAQVTLVKRRLREMEKDYKTEHGKAGAVLRR
ncbi:MAG: peptide deformylase [Planctomycetes bacterium]|nr:peptide deformylase [Planctomycetota bacterium]